LCIGKWEREWRKGSFLKLERILQLSRKIRKKLESNLGTEERKRKKREPF